MPKRTEAEIARVVMDSMLEQGWDCYPEVELPYGGRADIVGVRPFPFCPNRQCVHIVECKTSWTLSLLSQGVDRCAFAHYVTLAAPTSYTKLGYPSTPSAFYMRLCREHGLGLVKFEKSADLAIDDLKSQAPRLVRHKEHKFLGGPARLIDSLHEDMKRYAPGTQPSAGYSTTFRRTMDRCEKYVRDNPGCTVKEIVQVVEHHYARDAGFKQGILKWLWKRDGIDARKEGRCIRFYPEGAPSVQPELLTS